MKMKNSVDPDQLAEWWQSMILRDSLFYPILKNNGFFFLLSINFLF